MKEAHIRDRKAFERYLELVAHDAKRFFKPRDLIIISCPACGSEDHVLEFEKEKFRYVTCKKCRTLFANPRPNAARLKEFYTGSRSAKFYADGFLKPVAEARRSAIFRPRAERAATLISRSGRKVIGDIGAGLGLFLGEMRKIKSDARYIAIEPSVDMARICQDKGFEVISESIENIRDEYKNYFFLLTAFELLEHLSSPSLFFKKVYNILRPGGYFYLTTLNAEGFDIQILWEKSKNIHPPDHINLFNPDSISYLARASGFEILEVNTPGRLDWDIVEERIRQDRLNIGKFWSHLAHRGSDGAKHKLQKWITRNNFSSHMSVILKKAG